MEKLEGAGEYGGVHEPQKFIELLSGAFKQLPKTMRIVGFI
jgi:hypothetical protein